MKTFKSIQIALSLSVIAFFFSSCDSNCVTGSGKQVSETRSVGDFSEIETGGSIKLIIKQGPKAVRVVADDNILKLIKTDVDGNTLDIDQDGNFCNSGSITVLRKQSESFGY